MRETPGDSRSPRLLVPGMGALLGYVLVVGISGLSTELDRAPAVPDPRLGLLLREMVWPSWYVDLDEIDLFTFWSSNLRTVLFVGLAMAALYRVNRWFPENTARTPVFVATAGAIALSAVTAGLAAAVITISLLPGLPVSLTLSSNRAFGYLLEQLGLSASFGVVFGAVLGVVVVLRRSEPTRAARRVDRANRHRPSPPKSFW